MAQAKYHNFAKTSCIRHPGSHPGGLETGPARGPMVVVMSTAWVQVPAKVPGAPMRYSSMGPMSTAGLNRYL